MDQGLLILRTTRKPGERDNVGALLLETTSGNKILMDEDE